MEPADERPLPRSKAIQLPVKKLPQEEKFVANLISNAVQLCERFFLPKSALYLKGECAHLLYALQLKSSLKISRKNTRFHPIFVITRANLEEAAEVYETEKAKPRAYRVENSAAAAQERKMIDLIKENGHKLSGAAL